MSKGKNNKQVNNSTKVPVKIQPLKPTKSIVNKNVKQCSPNQIKNIKKVLPAKPQVVTKKENIDIKQKKDFKKVEDIVESCDDQDESDIEFSEIGSDSDIDDVDLEDDEDLDDDEDDIEDDDEDDDDISFEEFSDNESIELDESKLEESKPSSQALKTEKKATPKVVEKSKMDIKKVEIDESTESGKLLIEMNRRKNLLGECVVYVKDLCRNTNRSVLADSLNNAKIVKINLPGKNKGKKFVNRSYCFIQCANATDADKLIEDLNGKTVDGQIISATKFVCKKVFNDSKKIDLKTICARSFKNEDITQVLKNYFKVPVHKNFNIEYTVRFVNEKDARGWFDKEKITVNGHELLLNFYYGSELDKEPVSEIKTAVKRPFEDNEDQVRKKTKLTKTNLEEKVAPVQDNAGAKKSLSEKNEHVAQKGNIINQLKVVQIENKKSQQGQKRESVNNKKVTHLIKAANADKKNIVTKNIPLKKQVSGNKKTANKK